MKGFILMTCLLQTALAAPQLISFKDGKVGVNFFGYHAEAGLGGGQNSGGLLGGLHASAGTPWGQNAAAGLGGNVNGRASGLLYAGAQATPEVGAGAVLGGDTSEGGFSASQSYANGKVNSHTRTIAAGKAYTEQESAEPQYPPQAATENANAIQKIRPPKKYYPSESYNFASRDAHSLDKPAVASSIRLTKTLNKTEFASSVPTNDKRFLASESLTATPTEVSSTASLNYPVNGHKADGNNAKSGSANKATAVIIARDKTKLRSRAGKQRRNPNQKRLKANRQRQRSKKILRVVEHNQERQQLGTQDQYHGSLEDQLPTPAQHQQTQQRPVRRQLIAPAPVSHDSPVPSCDSSKHECKRVHKEVRTDVVQSALQIPIGILQSLQQTLGHRGSH